MVEKQNLMNVVFVKVKVNQKMIVIAKVINLVVTMNAVLV